MKSFLFLLLLVFLLFSGCINNPSGEASNPISKNPINPDIVQTASSGEPTIQPRQVGDIGPAVGRPDLIVVPFNIEPEVIPNQTISFDVFVKNIGVGTFNGQAGVSCTLIQPNGQNINIAPTFEHHTIGVQQEEFFRNCEFQPTQIGNHTIRVTISSQVSEPSANNVFTINFSVIDLPDTIILWRDNFQATGVYPYSVDANRTRAKWVVYFNFGKESDSGTCIQGLPYDKICSIDIYNKDPGVWENEWAHPYALPTNPPLVVPSQALSSYGEIFPDNGDFLFDLNSNYPGYKFFNYKFLGFEENNEPKTDVWLGSEPHTFNYNDPNNINHNFPFMIKLQKDTPDSSFAFDGGIIYYASTSQDYQNWDGNATFSIEPVPTSDPSDFLVTASDGRKTVYWTDGNITSDPITIVLGGNNEVNYKYRIYADNSGTDLYLILEGNQVWDGLYDADIKFYGTDLSENGFGPGFGNQNDKVYYLPFTTDFSSLIPSNPNVNNLIAIFGLETSGDYTTGAELVPDFDTNIFVDTATGELSIPTYPLYIPAFFYQHQINFFETTPAYLPGLGNIKMSYDNFILTPTGIPLCSICRTKSYTDWGTYFEFIDTHIFHASIPNNARKLIFEVSKGNDTKTFTTGESFDASNFSSFSHPNNQEFSFEISKQSGLSELIDINSFIEIDNLVIIKNFKEKIIGKADSYMSWIKPYPQFPQTEPAEYDLYTQIKPDFMKYRIELGSGLPRYFTDTGEDDEIIIPFFGTYWNLTSAALQPDGNYAIILEST